MMGILKTTRLMESCKKSGKNSSGVYKISSKAKPQRCYIGSSVWIRKRWAEHIHSLRQGKHHSPKLQSHYNKYGEDDLVFSIIATCDANDLIRQEQFFLDAYNPWFNVLQTAYSCLGMKLSEEAKAKISESNRRRTVRDETKRKISEANTGRRPNQATRDKMSASGKGKRFSEEHKKKISEALKGREFSEETKQRMREGRKDRVITDETRRKLSESHKGEKGSFYGKKHNEETKQKLREATIRFLKEHPGFMKEARKKVKPYSQERRAKMAEITRQLMASRERRDEQSEIAYRSNHKRWHGDVPYDECPKCREKRRRKRASKAAA